MSSFGVPEDGSVSLALALALVFACAAPMWAVPLLMARSSRWVGRRSWLKVLVAAYGMATLTLGTMGWGRVYHKLIGPGRSTEQGIVYGAWFANLVLLTLSIVWVKKRQGGAGAAPWRPQPKKRPITLLVVVLLVWVGLWGAYAFVRLGPFGATPLSEREWIGLGLACFLTALLAWVLFINVREARRTATKQGGGPMGVIEMRLSVSGARLLTMAMLVIAVLGGGSRAPEGRTRTTLKVTGTVLEQVDSPPYTYLRIQTEAGERWAAVPIASVAKNSTVTVNDGVVLKDFDTGVQGRRFDVVFGTLERR